MADLMLRLDDPTDEQLTKLSQLTGKSREVTTRTAIRLLGWIVNRLDDGHKVAFLKKDCDPIIIDFT